MPRKRRCKVFVSYSRHDEELVKPLAGLLGAAANDAVFLDVNSINPGELWKSEIETALRDAPVFVLCWCCESMKSEFVASEVKAAVGSKDKRLVPVLFCSAPLPPAMADRQWIDLRGRIVHACGDHGLGKQPAKPADWGEATRLFDWMPEPSPPTPTGILHPRPTSAPPPMPSPLRSTVPAPMPKRSPWKWAGVGAAAAVLLAVMLAVMVANFSRVKYAPSTAATPLPSTPKVAAPVGHAGNWHIITALIPPAIILLLIAFLLVKTIPAVRERSNRRHTERLARAAEGYFQGLGK